MVNPGYGNPNNMIKQLNKDNLNEVMAIIKEVIVHMNQQGINQWDEFYPDMEIITRDLKDNCAYGYFDNDELSGYVAISEDYYPGYDAIEWKIRGKFTVIHRLFVKPDKQRKGIAKKLMEFAEKLSLENGYKSIRLDAFSKNPAALKFYDDTGYKRVGSFEARKKGLFFCYEKEL